MIKFLVKLWKDERGFWTAALGGYLAGKKDTKGSTETYDPNAETRTKYQDWINTKLGTSTPYKYNEAFTIDQPEVESAAEKSILGYFNDPKTNVSDYSEATKKYSDAAKASREASAQEEIRKSKDMYNRLGLVSSTPGLAAVGDINESQRLDNDLFDSELMYKNLDRQLSAQGLDVNQLNSMLGQAQTLGQTQRGSQEYSQQMSMQDLQRMVDEEYGYGQQAATLLGMNPPERTYNPSIWEQLLGVTAKVAPQAATAAIMSSDIRLKEDIKDTGHIINGLKVYTWKWRNWVSDNVKKCMTIGFIAQEVQKVKPEAIKMIDGYLAIDYSLM